MIDAYVLALARTLPATLLAPWPAAWPFRLALAAATAGWCASSANSPLTAANLLGEFLTGFVVGLVLLLAADAARGMGWLSGRPAGASTLGPFFGAAFWVVFFSGPHTVWLRGLSRPHPVSQSDVITAYSEAMLGIVDATLPVLATFAVVQLSRRASEVSLATRLPRGIEPLAAVAVLLIALHTFPVAMDVLLESLWGGLRAP